MYLKRLELSGFKSFAKHTVFEFTNPITAIVGPNGSGKSNVAEAIRWVLGEQSMKSLRSKRGEDLIFNGSEGASRMGRAEVRLVFDNSEKHFSVDFNSVVIVRRVTRDGTNDYLLNGSAVRLKDVIEILSGVGLGVSQHHIISQGESDRILWASMHERQEMFEDALGLKEYHLKKDDAVRKLSRTQENMKQVELLRREIKPHLRFLKEQTDKMRAAHTLREELKEKFINYISMESAVIEGEKADIAKKSKPLVGEEQKRLEKIDTLQNEIKQEEKQLGVERSDGKLKKAIADLDQRRRRIEREIGRLEGALMVTVKSDGSLPSPQVLMREIKEAVEFVDALMQNDSFEALRSGLKDVKVKLEEITKLLGSKDAGDEIHANLKRKKELLESELADIADKVSCMREDEEEDDLKNRDILKDLRDKERRLREEDHRLQDIKTRLQRFGFSSEKLRQAEKDLEEYTFEYARLYKDKLVISRSVKVEPEQKRLTERRAIERLKMKLEEVGGMDKSVVREYDEVMKRDQFLAAELDDLKKAASDLHDLVKELDKKLEYDFESGVEKINNEFQKFFKEMFGGGKAKLVHIRPKKSFVKDGDEEVEVVDRGGVDISVDLPKKRIRGLDVLSGGERALTSIALLFAMSAVNPPPFLVLDETDAALDEANSRRYGRLLQSLSPKTQLIVVTHNRATMKAAGELYGVTIGSDGISRLLSLKLEEAKDLAGAKAG